MAKKDSGLGRGLDELLLDNTPEVKTSGSVIKRDGGKEISVNHGAKEEQIPILTVKNAGNYTEQTSTPHVFATVEPITAKNDSVIIEQMTIENVEPTVITADSTDTREDTPPTARKSLKALFREYK